MKTNVLISIKPKYVKEIVEGRKCFEFRKSIFKRDVDKVYIYSSAPEKKIVGYFNYNGYIVGSPQEVWEETKKFSGIEQCDYNKYYNGKKIAYAIKIDKLILFKHKVDPYKYFEKFNPPQSYMYLEGEINN